MVVEQGIQPTQLVPIETALSELPELKLSAVEAEKVRHGGRIEVGLPEGGPMRLVSPDSTLLAIADVIHGRLKYRRVLHPAT